MDHSLNLLRVTCFALPSVVVGCEKQCPGLGYCLRALSLEASLPRAGVTSRIGVVDRAYRFAPGCFRDPRKRWNIKPVPFCTSPVVHRGVLEDRAVRSKVNSSQIADRMADEKPKLPLRVFENGDHLGESLAEYVAQLSQSAVAERGVFNVVLSGGSLIKNMACLTQEPYVGTIEWANWYVYWADERAVPLVDSESNYKLAYDGLLSKVPVPHHQVLAIKDPLHSVDSAAAEYESGLRQLVEKRIIPLNETGSYPRFDLILLGMGPDGHIASLFPNHPLVSKTEPWIASIKDSPKPPPERITFTLPVINSAANIAFVVTGSNKAEKLKLIFSEDQPFGSLPAQLVKPDHGKLVWFTDRGATADLTTEIQMRFLC